MSKGCIITHPPIFLLFSCQTDVVLSRTMYLPVTHYCNHTHTQDDMRDGFGLFTYAHGDTYKGNYVAGKRSGRGSYQYSNGDFFEGDFVDGEKCGKGMMRYAGRLVPIFSPFFSKMQKGGYYSHVLVNCKHHCPSPPALTRRDLLADIDC